MKKADSKRFDLTDRVAVIMGGTGVLCGEIARGLAQAGAQVVLVGRDQAKAQTHLDAIAAIDAIENHGGAGGEAEGAEGNGAGCFEPCDVTDLAQLKDLCTRIHQRFGRIDVLINGAGVNAATPFLEISEKELDQIIGVNLKSVVFACQVFGRYFLNQNTPASIINVGSASGLTPLSRVFTYSATKAAVHNLTKNLAREWASQGIRVNTLVPGFIPAEQNKKVLTPERTASIMNHTPMNRFGKPQELMGAVLLLASDAGSFITGSELVVDGGFNAMTI